MLPVLLDLKFIKIYTFGVFVVLALFWGLFVLWKNIKLTSYKEDEIFDAFFISLFGGLFLSRLIYVFLNFEDFGFNILKFILINGYPGLSLLGLLSGSILILYLIFKSKKINVLEVFDYFVPAFFLAAAIGKIGSFFAGVDVGTTTNFILSVKYMGYSGSRHVVAIYESILFATAFYLSYKILLAVRRGKYESGLVFYFSIFYFSLTNLLLDFIKENHLYFLGRSINLWASIVFVFLFSLYFAYHFRNKIILYIISLRSKVASYVKKNRQGNSKKT